MVGVRISWIYIACMGKELRNTDWILANVSLLLLLLLPFFISSAIYFQRGRRFEKSVSFVSYPRFRGRSIIIPLRYCHDSFLRNCSFAWFGLAARIEGLLRIFDIFLISFSFLFDKFSKAWIFSQREYLRWHWSTYIFFATLLIYLWKNNYVSNTSNSSLLNFPT